MATVKTQGELIEEAIKRTIKHRVDTILNQIVDEATVKLREQIMAESAAITTGIMLVRPINSMQDKIEITIQCPSTRIYTNA